jgi:DNA-binding transcriptional regulator YiaG
MQMTQSLAAPMIVGGAGNPAASRGVAAITFESSSKDVQTRIGAAIRRRRRAVEVTLLELARACGVSFQQVQKYESGACSISAAQLWNMACALQVPISYFYEGDKVDA